MSTRKKSVYNFNHIDNELNQDEIDMLKKIYSHYHKKTWCYKMAFKYFRRINVGLNVTSIILTATGSVVGAVTLNPIVLGTVTGAGLTLQGFIKMKNYNRKIEMCKFAYTSYQKVLNEIRSYLRGEPYDIEKLTLELNWLDNQITDLCPLVDKFKAKYDKIYEN